MREIAAESSGYGYELVFVSIFIINLDDKAGY
jgi:hypothetical protein